MHKFSCFIVFMIAVFCGGVLNAQESDEAKEIKEEIERLQKKLSEIENAEFDNEYIVPSNIDRFPPNFYGHSPLDFSQDAKNLWWSRKSRKDEFETSNAFIDRLKAIWSEGKMLGQPVDSRFAFVYYPKHVLRYKSSPKRRTFR